MLAKLVSASMHWKHAIVSLRDAGVYGRAMEEAGAFVHTLGISSIGAVPSAAFRLQRLLYQLRPSLVQGWLPHGNMMATLSQALSCRPIPLLWNIRQSLVNFRYESSRTSSIIRLNACLSRLPVAIIYNSVAGAEDHEAIGYDRRRRRVIPNGFDVRIFSPSAERRNSMRKKLGVADDELVIGLVARFHPMKNHAGFFKMAEQIIDRVPQVRFLLAGEGTELSNLALRALVPSERVAMRTLFLGERRDIPDVTRVLDIACNISVHGEGFPNAVGEAMACGVPCVVTSIGDTAQIVGDTGIVCSDVRPASIVRAIERLVADGPQKRAELGVRARARIKEHFSLDAIVGRFENLYDQIVSSHDVK